MRAESLPWLRYDAALIFVALLTGLGPAERGAAAAQPVTSRLREANGALPSRPVEPFQLAGVVAVHATLADSQAVEPLSGRAAFSCIDLSVPAGDVTLLLRRDFDPAARSPGWLGLGWRTNWDRRVVSDGELAAVIADGKITPFRWDAGTGRYRSAANELLDYTERGATLTRPDGTADGFDSRGRLVQIRLKSGQSITLSYLPSGSLARVDGPYGSWLEFVARPDGLLAEARGSNGSSVRYLFGDEPLPPWSEEGAQVAYGYDAQGLVGEVLHANAARTTVEYDARGRVVRLSGSGGTEQFEYQETPPQMRRTDAAGGVTQWLWDEAARRVEIVTPDGRRGSLQYDENGRAVAAQAVGNVQVAYDNGGRPVAVGTSQQTLQLSYQAGAPRPATVTDSSGVVWSFSYDAAGRPTVLRRGSEDWVKLSYRPDGLPETVKVWDEPARQIAYDDRARVSGVSNPAGGATRLRYDERGLLAEVIDPLNRSLSWNYDEQRRVTSFTDAGGGTVLYEYAVGDQPATIRDPLGAITRVDYDDLGRVTRVQTGDAQPHQFGYDSRGRMIQHTERDDARYAYDAAGRLSRVTVGDSEWTYRYDVQGRLVEETGPLNHRRAWRYDDLARTVELEDALGRKSMYALDEAGRLMLAVDPVGRVKRLQYDERGRLAAVVESSGRRTAVQYDELGRVTSVARDDVQILRREYAGSRLRRVVGPGDTGVLFGYDPAGRLSSVLYGNGERDTIRFDPVNRPIERTDAGGVTWKYAYGPRNELTSVELPGGARQQYEYDALGRLTRVVNPRGHARRVDYDAQGRPAEITDALGRASRLSYNAAGRVADVTLPDGYRLQNNYDALGRLTAVQPPAGAASRFEYDSVGNIVRESEGAYAAAYKYDELNRIVSAVYQPSGQTVNYRYDPQGRRAAVEVVGLGSWQYRYDARDRPVEIVDPQGQVAKLAYDESGRVVKRTLPNGAAVERTYDHRGRLLLLRASGAGVQHVDRRYAYDASGNLLGERRESGGTFRYRYDAEGRLAGVSGPGVEQTMNYDAAGNPLFGGVAEYDAADQIVRLGDEHFTHDDRGAIIGRQSPRGRVEYVYEKPGRLTQVKRNGQIVVEYGYDIHGRRLFKKSAGKTVHYVYDGPTLLCEVEDGGRVTRWWTHGPELDQPIACMQGGATYYPVADVQASTVVLLDARGAAVSRWDYDPYGRPRPAPGANPASGFAYGYGGGAFDLETGLVCFRARYYDPQLGRFLSPDPAGGQLSLPQSFNPYQYALNNPLRYRDPSGAGIGEFFSTAADFVKFTAESTFNDVGNFVQGRSYTAEDLANGLTDFAGRAGASAGYGVGYATGYALTSPGRLYNWATGNTRANERINQRLETFASEVTGTAMDTAAASVTSFVTDPLRLGSGAGEAAVEWDQGHKLTAVALGIGDLGRGLAATSVVSRTVNGVAAAGRALRTPAGPPTGLTDPAIREMYLQAAQNPVFRAVQNVYARLHGREIDWPALMDDLSRAHYPRMSGADVVRAGPGVVAMDEAGRIILSVAPLEPTGILSRIPIVRDVLRGVGNWFTRETMWHELTHVVQNQLWKVFELERSGALSRGGAQVYEIVPSLIGDPTFKIGATYLMWQALQGLLATPEAGRKAGDLSGLTGFASALGVTGQSPAAQLVAVPPVIGHPLQSAVNELRGAKLGSSFVVGKPAPDEKRKNQVYYQEPEAGTQVALGTTVRIMFYSNPARESVKVPDLFGMTREQAAAKLQSVKLKGDPIAGKDKPPMSARRYSVYRQNPAADTEVFADDTVRFEYYAGIPVQRYIGLKRDAAEKAIREHGFAPQVHEGKLNSENPAQRYNVYEQNPAPGEYAWYGDVVDASYYKFSEGFQDGDGVKHVDARFTNEIISDGEMPGVKLASAGERTLIYLDSKRAPGAKETATSLGWSIRKYANAGEAKQHFDTMANMYPKASISGPYLKVTNNTGGGSAVATMDLKTDRNQSTTIMASLIYRDVFVISYWHIEPRSGLDFTGEWASVAKRSQALVDLRFPK